MTESDVPALGRRVAGASITMVVMRFAFRGIGLLSTLVLVRLIAPDDFGLLGLATAQFSARSTCSPTHRCTSRSCASRIWRESI